MPHDTAYKRKVGRPRTEDRNPDLAARAVAIIEAEGSKALAARSCDVGQATVQRILKRNGTNFGEVKQALTRQWSLFGATALDKATPRMDEMSAMQLVIAAGIASDKIAKLTETASQGHGVQVNILNQLEDRAATLKAKLEPLPVVSEPPKSEDPSSK